MSSPPRTAGPQREGGGPRDAESLPSRPRILFVDQTAKLGGAELSLLDVVQSLPARPIVLLFEDGPFRRELEAVGVRTVVETAGRGVRGVRRDGAGAFRAVPGLARLVSAVARYARSADVVYANTQKAFVVAALAGRLARRPVVWHLRDLITAEHFSPLHRALDVFLANTCAARVVANSAATAQSFVDAGGRSDRVCVVHNGIDPAPFDAVSEREVRAAREELEVGPGTVVGVFSRLAEWKGQHVLLDAIARVPGAHALIVGDALFDSDRAYAARLRSRAAHPDLAGRVRFVGFRSDVPVLMSACDVVAHTSVSAEPFGRVVVEGMLAGRPVVATDAGGVREIVSDGRTGRLVPPGDADALAEALRRLAADPDHAAELAEEGRAEARQRFTVGAMVEGVAAVVDAALHGGDGATRRTSHPPGDRGLTPEETFAQSPRG